MYAVFDIGATNTRVAVSADPQDTTLSDILIFPTDQNFNIAMGNLISNIENLSQAQTISGLAGGIPGVLNSDHSELTVSINLPLWEGQPLQQTLTNHFNCPVTFGNDVELIGLSEATFGAGKGLNLMGYLTISSGINGVRIVDRRIDKNVLGFELGYQIINMHNSYQSLEEAAGGKSLEQRYSKSPKELAKDPAIWEPVLDALAVGVHNAILFWSPEVIIFGGGMMRDIPLDDLRLRVGKLLKPFPEPPEFRLAELGDKGGLLGALVMAKNAAI